MGTISDMLNTLGYGGFVSDSSILISKTNDNDDHISKSVGQTQVVSPKGYLTNGSCAGCELSARFF